MTFQPINGIALCLNRLDHVQNELQALQLAHDLRLDARRQFLTVSGAQLLQPRQSVWPKWLVVVDAVDRAQTLDAVDMLDAFVDQAITLAMQPTVIFFGNTWHAHNAPHLLTAQIRQQ